MEAGAKFCVKRPRIMSHNIGATAFYRSLGTESADNDVTARFDSRRDITNISEPVLQLYQEVKHRSLAAAATIHTHSEQ